MTTIANGFQGTFKGAHAAMVKAGLVFPTTNGFLSNFEFRTVTVQFPFESGPTIQSQQSLEKYRKRHGSWVLIRSGSKGHLTLQQTSDKQSNATESNRPPCSVNLVEQLDATHY